jgi:hypothetical protein
LANGQINLELQDEKPLTPPSFNDPLLPTCDKDPLDLWAAKLPADAGSNISFDALSLDWQLDPRPCCATEPATTGSVSATPQPAAYRSTLHIAVDAGGKSMVQLLLDNGADVSRQDRHGKTALFIAAERGHDEIARMLLESSADPNKTDTSGRTALFAAVVGGSEAVADLLLAHSARVDVRDQQGVTPLHLAVAAGLESMVLLLISKGADVDG